MSRLCPADQPRAPHGKWIQDWNAFTSFPLVVENRFCSAVGDGKWLVVPLQRCAEKERYKHVSDPGSGPVSSLLAICGISLFPSKQKTIKPSLDTVTLLHPLCDHSYSPHTHHFLSSPLTSKPGTDWKGISRQRPALSQLSPVGTSWSGTPAHLPRFSFHFHVSFPTCGLQPFRAPCSP